MHKLQLCAEFPQKQNSGIKIYFSIGALNPRGINERFSSTNFFCCFWRSLLAAGFSSKGHFNRRPAYTSF